MNGGCMTNNITDTTDKKVISSDDLLKLKEMKKSLSTELQHFSESHNIGAIYFKAEANRHLSHVEVLILDKYNMLRRSISECNKQIRELKRRTDKEKLRA